MMDEAHVSGWYHSPFTIGPNPKPMYIGAILYILLLQHIHGKLLQFYLNCRRYSLFVFSLCAMGVEGI